MEDLNWSRFSHALICRTNRLVFLQAFPGCIGWSAIATFLPDFIHRDLGFTQRGATAIMSCFGVSGLIGAIVGGGVGQQVYESNRKGLPFFIACCSAFAAIPMMLLVTSGSVNSPTLTAILALLGGVATAAGPNLKGILMNANPSADRGSVFALFTLVDHLGKGIGPSVVVLVSLVTGSRATAMVFAFGFWIVSAFVMIQLESCLVEDTLNVEIKEGGESVGAREPFDLFGVY